MFKKCYCVQCGMKLFVPQGPCLSVQESNLFQDFVKVENEFDFDMFMFFTITMLFTISRSIWQMSDLKTFGMLTFFAILTMLFAISRSIFADIGGNVLSCHLAPNSRTLWQTRCNLHNAVGMKQAFGIGKA